jgi:adenosylcobinamide-GDP ribazoletransferase
VYPGNRRPEARFASIDPVGKQLAMFSTFARHYLLALQFFTRIPVTGGLAVWVGYSPAMLRASAAHFPGVGWLVGAITAGVSAAMWQLLPGNAMTSLVVAVLGTVVSVMLTGAFHEDGLADVADGLGGLSERERALTIMKDSRVGAFGALALVLMLLTKGSLLALIGSVDARLMCWALFAAHVVSRFFPLLLIRAMPYVGDAAGSKSKPLADQISANSLCVAALWLLAALGLVAGLGEGVALLAPLACATLAWLVMWRWFAVRLQGFTGDCLGATQQVCEVAFYFGLAITL